MSETPKNIVDQHCRTLGQALLTWAAADVVSESLLTSTVDDDVKVPVALLVPLGIIRELSKFERELQMSTRKPHIRVPQHFYLEWVQEYGPTCMADFMDIFDVSDTTAERNLEGLVHQGKLKYAGYIHDKRHRHNRIYALPDGEEKTSDS